MDGYVENGYVENGYVIGLATVYDPSTTSRKKVNFIVDNQGLDEENLNNLLLDKVGENYQEQVNIIFGSSLKVAEMINDVFLLKEIIGGISQEQLNVINDSITNVNNRVNDVSNLTQSTSFINSVATQVINALNVNLVASNGDLITTGLTYNEDTDSFILDYDTSLLDGTDYTIEITIAGGNE